MMSETATGERKLIIERLSFFNYLFATWRVRISLNGEPIRGIFCMWNLAKRLSAAPVDNEIILLARNFRRSCWIALGPWVAGALAITLATLLGWSSFFNFLAYEMCHFLVPSDVNARIYSRAVDMAPEAIFSASLSIPMLLIGLVLFAFALLYVIDSYRSFLKMVERYNEPARNKPVHI